LRLHSSCRDITCGEVLMCYHKLHRLHCSCWDITCGEVLLCYHKLHRLHCSCSDITCGEVLLCYHKLHRLHCSCRDITCGEVLLCYHKLHRLCLIASAVSYFKLFSLKEANGLNYITFYAVYMYFLFEVAVYCSSFKTARYNLISGTFSTY